jgi:hypothetical protein
MPLKDINPLNSFRKLHLLPRVLFAIGGLLFCFGWPFTKDWRVVVLGAGLMFVAVGYNFFAKLIWHESEPPYRPHISWANLFQGLVSFAIGLSLAYVVFFQYKHGVLPNLLRPSP